MSELIGKYVDRYHILEQLGEGGMATVYKAFDTRLERDVAIKVIRTELFGKAVIDRILKRFEREAKALARLSHPNIVKVHDFGEYEEAPYLVMEYLPGGTLKSKLRQPIPWQQAFQTLLPIISALAYAHKQKIIHRDLKPSNILLTDQGQTLLTDFGIAKILELDDGQTLTGTGMGVGTPEYMAPEQGMGKDVDGRADIYALGVVMYEMLTGHKPYTADTPMAVTFKHMTDPLPRPRSHIPDLPDRVEKLLLKALAKEAKDRYQSMDEVETAMQTLLREKLESQVQPKQETLDQDLTVDSPETQIQPFEEVKKATKEPTTEAGFDFETAWQTSSKLLEEKAEQEVTEKAGQEKTERERKAYEELARKKGVVSEKIAHKKVAKQSNVLLIAKNPVVITMVIILVIAFGFGYLLLANQLPTLLSIFTTPTKVPTAQLTNTPTEYFEYTRYEIPIDGFPSLGPDNAEIVLVEFGDFEDPFSNRWHNEVYEPLLRAYPAQIRFVFRNLPLTSIHPEAFPAAIASLCANEQNAYWPYHEKLFTGDLVLGSDSYIQYAIDLGLDKATFDDCLNSGKFDDFIQEDIDFAINLGIRSTPTFFVNGLAIVGAQPLATFTQVIDQELAGEIPK